MNDILAGLNDVQAQAVRETDGAVLVLAGAGSGKTRVLTHRVAYLIHEKKVNPYNILAITFTNKAAEEMKERIIKLTRDSNVWVSTFHSMCAKILYQHAERLGYKPNFSIYSEVDSERLIKRVLSEKHIDDEDIKKNAGEYIGKAKTLGLSPEEYEKNNPQIKDIDKYSAVFAKYNSELKNNNAMDFDDLLLKAIELFLTCPDVLEHYQNRFRYVHIDEFQDTNKLQYLLAGMLSNKHGNLFVVGDDDQSIYSWRGADVRNILDFKKDYPDAKIFKLEQNYRSTAQILDAANSLIANNNGRHGKKLWTDKTSGVRVEINNFYNDRKEADYVIEQIYSLIRHNDYKPSDFAILVRVNALTRLFEEKLNGMRLPFKIFGGFKFYERKEIKDVISYLRVLINPGDTDSLLRIINFPRRGIGGGATRKIMDCVADRNMQLIDLIFGIEEMELGGAVTNRIVEFRGLLNDIINFSGMHGLGETAEYIVERAGFSKEYDTGKEEDENRMLNIKEFVEAVHEYEKENIDASLGGFLERISLVSDIDEMVNPDYISLATVHAVKGLEFKVVFVVGLEENIFPSLRSRKSSYELEEERRVMYVAITRARERLYVTSCSCRFRFGDTEMNLPSRFIKEIIGNNPVNTEKRITDKMSNNPQLVNSPSSVNKPKDISGFNTGVKVLHSTFGIGTVMSINGTDDNKTAVIAFHTAGIKTLALSIAPLTVVNKNAE